MYVKVAFLSRVMPCGSLCKTVGLVKEEYLII